jgi:D-alanyl-lipoteichoic acid acyltransferase DltB (MBOAT superfamily)
MALNSWQFVLLAATAVALLPVTRGWIRTGIFLALNLAFVSSYWGTAALPIGVGFLLLGYAAIRFVRGRGTAALVCSLTALTAVFIVLRGYSFDASPPSRTAGLGVVAIAGVSFLFFKIVHVVVDVASGTIPHVPFARYLNYCLNFTTVLMGPIQRFQDFATQWDGRDGTSPLAFEQAIDATNRVLRGFLKAFVLAPYLAPYALAPGVAIDTLSATDALLRIYTFYIFLYLDFSGYCDVVIGIGSLMGIRPPENFNFPFLARNVSEYWLRVHRSLTQWLTDYIFTPSYTWALRARGLARHGFLALAACLLLTMLVAGVWHGTTSNFVVFGLIHGVALVVMRGYDQVMTRWLGRGRFHQLQESRVATAAAIFLTYNFTSIAYVFFVLNVGDGMHLLVRLTTLAMELVA